jgi:hypothetical protein
MCETQVLIPSTAKKEKEKIFKPISFMIVDTKFLSKQTKNYK